MVFPMALPTNHSLGPFPVFIQWNGMQWWSLTFTVFSTPAFKELKSIASIWITKPKDKQYTTLHVWVTIYKKTIIFFNSKISPISNCVGYYRPILLTRKMTCPNSYGWLAVNVWVWFLMTSWLPCHCFPHCFVLNT